MTRSWLKQLLLLCLSMGFSWFWASAMRNATPGPVKSVDFAYYFYGARCVFEHKDPYLLLAKRIAEVGPGGDWPELNLPTSLLIVAPLATLPLPVAEAIWAWLTAGLLLLAGLAIWDLGDDSSIVAGCLVGFILLNCSVQLVIGNLAGIAVALCVIAAWCFLRQRYAVLGVISMAVSLVMKPHDAGFVWLYFLLAGGLLRKRALQTLAIDAVLGACAVLWIGTYAPHWVRELHNNSDSSSVRGKMNNPGPSGPTARDNFNPVISAQAAISLLRDDPNFYEPLSLGIPGGLVLVWAVVALRKRFTGDGALLGLAAISPLTMLPVYHRVYDAKLLLLMIPACALLWAGDGIRRWIALGLTGAAVFVTSDIPILVELHAARNLPASTATLGGKLVFLTLHPAPVVLLVAGCFYMWVYIVYKPPETDMAQLGAPTKAAATAAS